MARFELVAALVPLVLFYFVESAYGLQAGVLVAIAWVLVDLPVRWWFTGRVNRQCCNLAVHRQKSFLRFEPSSRPIRRAALMMNAWSATRSAWSVSQRSRS